jgi:hypothetical protein
MSENETVGAKSGELHPSERPKPVAAAAAGHQPQTAQDKVSTVTTKTETQSYPPRIFFKDLLSDHGLLPT